jgi:hypothetical protein
MSAFQALDAARAAGVQVHVDGGDLVLEASAAPPAAVLDLLRRHKRSIVVLLERAQPWGPTDWRGFFDERANIAEVDGGLLRREAEARAFDCCVAEWLLRNPVCSSSDRCLECRRSARNNDPLLAIGVVGAGEAWLHRSCVPAWHSARIGAAVEALKAMNIVGTPATSSRED